MSQVPMSAAGGIIKGIPEPLLIASMRRHPNGQLQYRPYNPVGLLGATTSGFLAEVDEWFAAAIAEARQEGYAYAIRDGRAAKAAAWDEGWAALEMWTGLDADAKNPYRVAADGGEK